MINVLNVIVKILGKKNLMEIHMENAYVLLAIMIIMKINYAKNALIFGNI